MREVGKLLFIDVYFAKFRNKIIFRILLFNLIARRILLTPFYFLQLHQRLSEFHHLNNNAGSIVALRILIVLRVQNLRFAPTFS